MSRDKNANKSKSLLLLFLFLLLFGNFKEWIINHVHPSDLAREPLLGIIILIDSKGMISDTSGNSIGIKGYLVLGESFLNV